MEAIIDRFLSTLNSSTTIGSPSRPDDNSRGKCKMSVWTARLRCEARSTDHRWCEVVHPWDNSTGQLPYRVRMNLLTVTSFAAPDVFQSLSNHLGARRSS